MKGEEIMIDDSPCVTYGKSTCDGCEYYDMPYCPEDYRLDHLADEDED